MEECALRASHSVTELVSPPYLMLAEFIKYKSLLIAGILLPPRFDTSSSLILDVKTVYDRVAANFLTWDSVYYVSMAHRGIRYEHEYAFSPVWVSVLNFVSPWNTITSLTLSGVMIAILSSYITGYFIRLTGHVARLNASAQLMAQYLYIYSPAGAFLIAGYPESPFACLSILGLWYFYKQAYIPSAIILGSTCLLRSNGVLWGILFAYKLFDSKRKHVRILLGGAIVGFFFLVPQVRLYNALCPGAEWCQGRIPLGYTYIQSKYWNVGFLKYWTPNNIPNFIFALPTLILLARSLKVLPTELKLVQIVYILGALFFWHVQIITRVASCLPGPYWYLAKLNNNREARLWKAYFVVWTLVQAVLFGAFLPPA